MNSRYLPAAVLVAALVLLPGWAGAAVVTISDLTDGNPIVTWEGFNDFAVSYEEPEYTFFLGTWTSSEPIPEGEGYVSLTEPGDPTLLSDYLWAFWGPTDNPGEAWIQGAFYSDPEGPWIDPNIWAGVPETGSLQDVTDLVYANPHDPGSHVSLPAGLQIWLASDVDAVIPEPSTFIIWSLLGALGIAVGWRRRRMST